MESPVTQILQLSFFPILLASFIFFLILVKYWKKSAEPQGKLPPGPKQLPIIGDLHQLIGVLPHHAMTNLCKKHGPVMKLQLGQILAVIISSPEAAKEVLKTNEINFAQRPDAYALEVVSYGYSSLACAPYNDHWRQLRKIAVMELFSVNCVQSFRSVREEEAWNLIEFIASSEGRTINLSDKFYSLATDVVSRAAIGSKCKYQQDFASVVGEIISVAGGFNIADLYPSLSFLRSMSGLKSAVLKIQNKTDKILEDIISEHKMKKNARNNNDDGNEEDLLDRLLNYEEANKPEFHLTTNQIKAVIMVRPV